MERMNLMTAYPQMTAQERKEEYARVLGRFEELKAQGLKLNMARGKPGKEQLDMVSDIFHLMQNPEDYVSDGIETRNYGEMSGLPAAKRLRAEIDELTARRTALQSEYKKAQREEREYDTLNQNVRILLERSEDVVLPKERSNELE